MDRFPIEHAGLAPSSAVMLDANSCPHENWATFGSVDFEVMTNTSRDESRCTVVNTKLSNWVNGIEMLTSPITLMLTFLPTTDAGTTHLTEVGELNVAFGAIKIKSANKMRQTLVDGSNCAADVVSERKRAWGVCECMSVPQTVLH